MATMIPESVERFKTEGEKQFYRFLEKVAKPDAQYISWYTPDIEGKEPDFILFNDKTGFIIFEIKDWILDQIKQANAELFTLQINNRSVIRKNPLKQARDYLYNVMDKIQGDGLLVSKEPDHHGRPKIPINYGVVFPNINKYEYTKYDLDKVISTDKIFFRDDLHTASDICTDTTGNCFFEALKKMLDVHFSFALTPKELCHLKQLIFPEVRINLPERKPVDKYINRKERIRVLDNNQEAIARKFDGGHRILVGPSGSGKTLVLIHKAAFLLKYNPDIKNILFICFNITLVNYIKRLLADKGVPLGENGIQVYHFYQLCTEIIKEEVAYENEESDYYDLVVQETLQKVKKCGSKYDAILVDEGQDFSDNMFRISTALLNKQTNNLTIALDDNQDIYQRKGSWKEIGVQARGRVHKIHSVYRNTKEITDFAFRFIQKEAEMSDEKVPKQIEMFSDFFDFNGPKPELKQFPDFDKITEFVTERTSATISAERCPLSEIAIIYAKKSIGDTDIRFLPQMMETALNSKSILCNWASENYHSKKSYDVTTDRVTISTIHSTKGFDYACVFLVGLDLLDEKRWSKDQIRNMTYVAITRARYELFIPYIHQNALIKRLLECT